MSFDLEEEFWKDPANVPQYDPNTLESLYPKEGPEEEPEDTRPALFDPADVPAGREPLPVPSEPMASNDPEFRPAKQQTPLPSGDAPQGTPDEGGGYDWRRMLASLFGGGEGVSQYDRQKLAEAAQRLQEKQAGEQNARLNSAEQRAQEKWGMERDIMNPAKAGKLDAEAGVLSGKAALMNPNSEQSKTAVKLMADRAEMQASRLPEGDERKKLLAQFVQNARAPGAAINVAEAKQWADRLRVDVSDIMRDAQANKAQDSKDNQNTEKNKQAWAKINALRSKAGAGEKRASERVLAVNAKEQAALDKEIEVTTFVKDKLAEIADLKKNVNTGFWAGHGQEILKKYTGVASPEFRSLVNKLAIQVNQKIHELSGSAVSKQELVRMMDQFPNIYDDDEDFEQKIAEFMTQTEAAKQMAISRLGRHDDGTPMINNTNTVRRVTAQKPRVLPGETAPPDATPGKAALDAKADKARRAIAGGTAAQQAGARAWLKANGYAE